MTQDVGQATSLVPKGKYMYIGLGTILLFVLAYFLFRALSGRRV